MAASSEYLQVKLLREVAGAYPEHRQKFYVGAYGTAPQEKECLIISRLCPKTQFKIKDSTIQDFNELFAIRHKNLVPYVGFVETDTHFGIASERTYGVTLRAEIDELKEAKVHLPEGIIRNWVAQIVDALHHIHKHSDGHGSLDPSQVLLVGNGGVKLMGFGIPQEFDDLINDDSESNDRRRSPARYKSPQVREGKKLLDKDDIWSVGALLFELCYLMDCPVADLADSGKEMKAQIKEEITCDKHAHLGYSEELKNLILDCLEFNRAKRLDIIDLSERIAKWKPAEEETSTNHETSADNQGPVVPDIDWEDYGDMNFASSRSEIVDNLFESKTRCRELEDLVRSLQSKDGKDDQVHSLN